MKLLPIATVAAIVVLATAQSAEADVSSYNNQILCDVNRARANNGLPALGLSEGLKNIAQAHSTLQARLEKMAHDLLGQSFVDRAKSLASAFGIRGSAENVAAGQKTPKEVFESWMKSAGHYKNIMGPHTHMGLGAAKGNNGQYYWTQDFGNDGKTHNFPICPGESAPAPAPITTSAPKPVAPAATPASKPAAPVTPAAPSAPGIIPYRTAIAPKVPTVSTKPRKCRAARLCWEGQSTCHEGKLAVCRKGRWHLSSCPTSRVCKVDTPLKACCQ
ncbi:CAP domain-containing protein [Thamnocephalis sphaerospora]|uniref:CAP domain-containing protein n=1 Tax=Thamnocephalis sphaerospora TaxID=78915 RepID=A0A4P9XQI5_9FUNG|nr:CAP domain-containing protein [Thamnocephalis sphaerospora]|eukprot:RKP08172.1 CAP domain-containing protein [Thamnocephalis sphaerospora]